MPKAFSENEKTQVRAQLLTTAGKHFARLGVRGARVDDICQDVGIAKGSFYAFFASKENLFMAMANAQDAKHKRDMMDFLVGFSGRPVDLIVGFFDFMMERIETDPVLKIVQDRGEIAHLMRKVSPDLLASNLEQDKAFLQVASAVLREQHGVAHADADALEGLMALMLCLGLQRETISAASDYSKAVGLLRSLFVDRLTRGPQHD